MEINRAGAPMSGAGLSTETRRSRLFCPRDCVARLILEAHPCGARLRRSEFVPDEFVQLTPVE